ncbi:MAG: hypothetical protein K940chlam7_02084, partial [Chlamydiae bacterium]|nr:hypothetical protein [Chlamydiota bacterium]
FDDSHPGRCHWAVALLAFQANKTVLKSTFQWEKQYLWVKGSPRLIKSRPFGTFLFVHFLLPHKFSKILPQIRLYSKDLRGLK